MGCCNNIRREFRCANFGLGHSKPDDFVRSMWRCCPSLIYVLYRLGAFFYFLGWIIYSGLFTRHTAVRETDRVLWFIYLTHWAFLILTVDLLLQFVFTLVGYVEKRRKKTNGPIFLQMTRYLKVGWVISNIASCIGIIVTILFWSLLFRPGRPLTWLTITTHGSNGMFIIVDIIIRAVPLRLYHAWHSMAFSTTYSIFSCIFTLNGGHNLAGDPYIYPQLNWNKNLTFSIIMSALTIFVAVPLVWLLLYFLFRLRSCISAVICRKDSAKVVDEEDRGGVDNQAVGVTL